ncbi:MarR family winged helix-turn-helix transcriptional regulator [Amycolatopsis benzoatilytica]|uniref:MarR family winged helix-turn-helix transcriptional regulator n=1 Tax=Amycolatopsis benzoatilytica TaxID=346045 RepID=UPI000381873F|nr:MarR family winged helix-turn-helix transcriptional regulator [Amycolatopsis benzoatilytica]
MGRTTRREAEARVLAALPSWVNAISQLNRLVAERIGVAASDLDCLHALNRGGPATAAELVGQIGLTPGSVSRMIDRLDAAGCIKRTADPRDRRRVLIEPTADGLARIAAYYDGLTARTRDDLTIFRLDELESLLRFIERSQRSAGDELARLRHDHDSSGSPRTGT